jgi:hypothetical protein
MMQIILQPVFALQETIGKHKKSREYGEKICSSKAQFLKSPLVHLSHFQLHGLGALNTVLFHFLRSHPTPFCFILL